MPLSSDKHIIDDQFSKRLAGHKASPSGKVWSRLSRDLHLKEEKSSNGRKWLLMLLFLVMGSGGLWVTSTLQPTGKKVTAHQQLAKNPEEHIPPGIQQVSEPAATVIEKSNTEAYPQHSSVQPVAAFLNEQAEVSLYTNLADEWTASPSVFSELNSMVPFLWTDASADMQYLSAENQLMSANRISAAKKKELAMKQYPVISRNPNYYVANTAGFYLGFGQTFNATFIVDRKAFSDKNLKFSPTFGAAVMFHAGYNISNKWGLESGWIIHSQQGQRYEYLPAYNRTTSLEYNQKHISFNYMQFPLLMKYRVQGWSGITQTPFLVNYSLGVQYGRLLSYSVNETKEKVSNQNLFRKNEYALVAALDYDFITRKPAFFTVGIRTSLGSNIFVKGTPEDLEFDDPHNFLIGVHGAVNFSLKKEQKVPGL